MTTGHPTESRRARRSGFTLLELVLVMVIVCTVLAVAAPSLRGFFAGRQTQNAAAGLVALTQLARSQAIADGNPYRLNVDTSAGTYWLTTQSDGGWQDLNSEFGRTFGLPEGVQITLSLTGQETGVTSPYGLQTGITSTTGQPIGPGLPTGAGLAPGGISTTAQQTDRSYVTFFPDGRTEPATITLSGAQGDQVVVQALSPADSFHVVQPQTGQGGNG